MKKVFILGLPSSGRTTIAKTLQGYTYIDTYSWIKSTFRSKKQDENRATYDESYHNYLSLRLKANPNLFIDNCKDSIRVLASDKVVLDGINNPRDFAELFNYNNDTVVFLNRNDNESDFKDYENIALTVMRDYCFWLSSIDLLPKTRWIELNFKMAGEPSDFAKTLGSKNSVFLVKSFDKGIEIVNNTLKDDKINGVKIIYNEISRRLP